MPWVRRSELEQLTGWIAGLGTDSGHRVVVGHWPTSPHGHVTDVMVQDPTGHRTPLRPTPHLGQFLDAAYRFDEVEVAPCSARRSGPAGRCRPAHCSLHSPSGAAACSDGCCGSYPPHWPERHGGQACRTLSPAGCRWGVRTRGRARDGRRQWHGARDRHPIIAAQATLHGRDLGVLGPVQPPVGFGFGSVPGRPSLVQLTTMIETVGPGDGSDAV